MSEDVKAPRPYDASRRREQAGATRGRILAAARELFVRDGYAGTSMAAIARAAGVNVDTVYTAVGTKVALLRTMVELAISGEDVPVTAEERAYVREMVAEPDPARKLARYAAAVRAIHQRLVPLFLVVRDAGAADAEIRSLWQAIAQRRADNMHRLAADIAATGGLRAGLDPAEVADVIWATNAPEFYDLLVGQRGWSPERFERWLASSWQALLLAPAGQAGTAGGAGGAGREQRPAPG